MRGFYNTVLHCGENAMEYLIRLNKAIDVAAGAVESCRKSWDRSGHVVWPSLSGPHCCIKPKCSICKNTKQRKRDFCALFPP